MKRQNQVKKPTTCGQTIQVEFKNPEASNFRADVATGPAIQAGGTLGKPGDTRPECWVRIVADDRI